MFEAGILQGVTNHMIWTQYGITLTGSCTPDHVSLDIGSASSQATFDYAGTFVHFGQGAYSVDSRNVIAVEPVDPDEFNFVGLVRDDSVDTTVQLSVYAKQANPCRVWGTITPTSS